jgi:hypothetical protein
MRRTVSLEGKQDMEVRFEVTSVYWVDDERARMNVDIHFGEEWVGINHVEVARRKQQGGYGVYVPRRRGGGDNVQPAVFLSDALYIGLRRAAIDAYKADRS